MDDLLVQLEALAKLSGFIHELTPYIQGCGLIDASLLPVPTPFERGDNSTMFFGESICIMSKLMSDPEANKELSETVRQVLAPCFIEPGLLKRGPTNLNQDGPDNMLGVLAACKLSGETSIPRAILLYGIRHLGFFNQPRPGKFTGSDGKISWEAFLWRQFQLVAATVSAARLGPFRLLALPFYLWTAGVILLSAVKRKPPTENMDSRRLAWLLVQIVRKDSLLCYLASKLWYMALRQDFPLSVWGQSMRGVASHYYEKGHPFSRYWVDV